MIGSFDVTVLATLPNSPLRNELRMEAVVNLLKRKAISEARSVLRLELYLPVEFHLNTPERDS